MIGLSNFEMAGGALAGGVKVIQYLPIADISTYPNGILNNLLKSQIGLKAGKAWFSAPVFPKISWSESQKNSKEGVLFDQNIQTRLPNFNQNIKDELQEMALHRFIVIVPLRLGVNVLIGSLDQPLSFSSSFASGDDFQGFPSHSLIFTGQTLRKSPVVTV
jgi:hypothetical protein